VDWAIGDVQGSRDALDRLLSTIGFSPSRDRLYLLGDLVNRGADSLGTLRRLRALGDAAVCLLGNHDWHLLAVAAGVRPKHRSDTLDAILDAPDREAWLDWLRARRMAVHAHGWLLLHAGVAPAWTLGETLALAGALEAALRDAPPRDLLGTLFGNEPSRWEDVATGDERLRFTLNVLTRIRFVEAATGRLDFQAKGGPGTAPPGLVPWFDAPGRRSAGTPVAFGHWSTLGFLARPDLLSLDTGCAWGGALTAVRLDGVGSAGSDGPRETVRVACDAAAG
jgi:bis(5'-nucleosyl)-tetraphosphatase (symmetrical)